MVRWYIQRIAINDETGQQANVFTKLSDWDDELYPSLWFEHFDNVPNYNMFQLLFPLYNLQKEGQALGEEE